MTFQILVQYMYTGLILGLRPVNERRLYKVTPSFIGWAQTYSQPCALNLIFVMTVTEAAQVPGCDTQSVGEMIFTQLQHKMIPHNVYNSRLHFWQILAVICVIIHRMTFQQAIYLQDFIALS